MWSDCCEISIQTEVAHGSEQRRCSLEIETGGKNKIPFFIIIIPIIVDLSIGIAKRNLNLVETVKNVSEIIKFAF